MIFDLTDEDRDALETIRKHRGHRSHAETLRELIRQEDAELRAQKVLTDRYRALAEDSLALSNTPPLLLRPEVK